MPAYCKVSPDEFERLVRVGTAFVWFQGVSFFDTKENCKRAASAVRSTFSILARSIVIPESSSDGGAYGGYFERYLLMLPSDLETVEILDFIMRQKGVE